MQIVEVCDLTGSLCAAAELAGCSHHIVARLVAERCPARTGSPTSAAGGGPRRGRRPRGCTPSRRPEARHGQPARWPGQPCSAVVGSSGVVVMASSVVSRAGHGRTTSYDTRTDPRPARNSSRRRPRPSRHGPHRLRRISAGLCHRPPQTADQSTWRERLARSSISTLTSPSAQPGPRRQARPGASSSSPVRR